MSKGKANTRPRDYYDVYILYTLYKNKIDFNMLFKAISSTCSRRGSIKILEIYKTRMDEVEKDSEMNKLWDNYEKNFEYAKGIKFKDICNIVVDILDGICSV